MKIGELSEATGVSVPTIRLYERDGLIAPADRTQGKFRVFSEHHRRRLNFIKRIRDLGFPLEAVKQLLSLPIHAESREKVVGEIEKAILARQRDLTSLDDSLRRIASDIRTVRNIEDIFDEI
ncbi:MAG: MerR family transcriptional regulator [Novosphingobium sp.]|nr:MAG: MerR family transcriptional regulator [Novosphingobium sp.]